MDNLREEIKKYVRALCGQKDVVKVNVARHNLFKLGKFAEDNLPPNYETLQQHRLHPGGVCSGTQVPTEDARLFSHLIFAC